MHLTDLRIFTEPQQGASYDDILGVATSAERLGFGAFFRSDHYLKMGAVTGLPGPSDAWTTLAGLARDTSTIRLGTLVTAATFRLPGPLAIAVAGVDQMSHGRVELGLGAGWFEAEHTAYGVPFPDVRTRFDRLEEQLAILTGLWRTPDGDTFAFDGRHYVVADSPALPKPIQAGGPPIIIGGRGARRTPALAAQYASEFNIAFAPVETFTAQRERVIAACEAIERDPATMKWSAALVACAAADDAGVARRAAAIGRDPDELRRDGAAGTVAETAATLHRWIDAGVDRIYLQFLDLADLEHLEVFASEVAPQLT
jgi:F420-dependent oxidoreductase-like protein